MGCGSPWIEPEILGELLPRLADDRPGPAAELVLPSEVIVNEIRRSYERDVERTAEVEDEQLLLPPSSTQRSRPSWLVDDRQDVEARMRLASAAAPALR